MARKPTYNPKNFESLGTYKDYNGNDKTDTSANIFESMLLSPAFKDLNSKQQILYVYCKKQYYGHRKPEKDYKDIEKFKGADLFYFNWDMAQKYGLYKPTMSSNFYNDMKALCEHGFVEKVSSGARQQKKNVYRFSSKWQTWSK